MAQQLISSLSADFDPARYHDEYRERVLELIEKKAAGEEIAVQPEAEEPAAAPDLMAALEASLAAVSSGDSDENPPAAPAAAPKPKPAAKKRASSDSNGDSAPKPPKRSGRRKPNPERGAEASG